MKVRVAYTLDHKEVPKLVDEIIASCRDELRAISNFNFEVLFPFGVGMLVALILMPRLINKAYEKFGKLILVFFGGLIFAAGIKYFL